MELFSKTFLAIHITAGFISIILFWLPMLSKKGGDLHIKAGRLYVKSMWVVVGTAAILSIKNFIIGDYGSAVFLGFLSLITSGPLWYSIAILDQKRGKSPGYKRKLFCLNLAILVWALGMIIYAIDFDHPLRIVLFIFGGLGLTSIPDIYKHIAKKESKLTWIQDHLIGMITTGIAAYTAFFVFGGSNIFGHLFQGSSVAILWVGPGILGSFANFYYSKKYEVKNAT